MDLCTTCFEFLLREKKEHLFVKGFCCFLWYKKSKVGEEERWREEAFLMKKRI